MPTATAWLVVAGNILLGAPITVQGGAHTCMARLPVVSEARGSFAVRRLRALSTIWWITVTLSQNSASSTPRLARALIQNVAGHFRDLYPA